VLRQRHYGLPTALNKGCNHAQGTYIARLDSDDVALADRIERQVEFLEARAEVALLGGGALFLDEKGTQFATVGYPVAHDELIRALETTCPFVHSAIVMRADAFREVGGYREMFPRSEDYDLWLRLSERFTIANLAEPVVGYRIHAGQTTLATLDDQARWLLIAQASHRLRVERGSDPLETGERRTWREWFDRLGIDEAALAAARVEARVWYAKTLTRAGSPSSADPVWAEAAELALALPDAERRRTEIADIRRAVAGERRRRRLRWRRPLRRRASGTS
jgi:glycosyltransferase involved in cell wall biosynthesis